MAGWDEKRNQEVALYSVVADLGSGGTQRITISKDK